MTRTGTLSACLISTPAMNTGFLIGKLTGMGSMRLIFIVSSLLSAAASLIGQDKSEQLRGEAHGQTIDSSRALISNGSSFRDGA